MKSAINIFWFRRDLRLEDNAGLYHALRDKHPVVHIFIFDRNILDELENTGDRRVEFIWKSLEQIQSKLIKKGTTLDVRYGFPIDVFRRLIKEYTVAKIFTNHDYDPYAKERDAAVSKLAADNKITFHSFKDHVIFEKNVEKQF